jgi:TolB-like protein/class 3 adenylate cyclase
VAEERIVRRLAAILAADVEGYSRLVGIDEEGTLAALKSLRKSLFDPKITEHRGRIVKNTGDGALVEFASAVDAVQCALEIQRAMSRGNADIPKNRRIELRIGINLGDIVIEDDDIFGDGVNIAARLESITPPGGVCISEDVYKQVRRKLDAAFEDIGEQQLKNIVQPVRVYLTRSGDASFGRSPSRSAACLALPDKPSIAVLPFQNMSGDPEQEYFADGIVEEIITSLSRFKNLFVIAHNSTFTYKGRAVDVKRVGHELGVRYVLEGSVRTSARRVRITAQLIDATTGAHLWADRVDGNLEEVFDLQDSVATTVMGAIAPKLEDAEIERAKRKPTESLDAYNSYLRGLSAVRQFSSEAIEEALSHFHRAIRLDREFAAAYGMIAWCYFRRYSNALTVNSAGESTEAIAMARRAVALGSDDAIALCMGGIALAGIAFEMEAGDAYLDRALALNRNLAIAWSNSGLVKIWMGEHASAIARVTNALRLNPHRVKRRGFERFSPRVQFAPPVILVRPEGDVVSYTLRICARNYDSRRHNRAPGHVGRATRYLLCTAWPPTRPAYQTQSADRTPNG